MKNTQHFRQSLILVGIVLVIFLAIALKANETEIRKEISSLVNR